MVTSTPAASAHRRQVALPWLLRVCVGVGFPAVVVARDVGTYGLERDGQWHLGEPMSGWILGTGLVLACLFAVAEGLLARRNAHVVLQCAAAAAGALVVGWFASLPVGLRFFASTEPARQEYVEMLLSSFLLMAVPYSLLVLLLRGRAQH